MIQLGPSETPALEHRTLGPKAIYHGQETLIEMREIVVAILVKIHQAVETIFFHELDHAMLEPVRLELTYMAQQSVLDHGRQQTQFFIVEQHLDEDAGLARPHLSVVPVCLPVIVLMRHAHGFPVVIAERGPGSFFAIGLEPMPEVIYLGLYYLELLWFKKIFDQ